MKTGGEKPDNYVADVDWDLITPPEAYLSEKAAKRARKISKKRRVISYKRRARRLVKQLTRLISSGKDM